MNYLISGFSGAGKSFIIKELIKDPQGLVGFNFYDLDLEVEKEIGLKEGSLGEWIRIEGMESFRKVERKTLLKLLKNEGNNILALGGGSLSPETLASLKTYPHQIIYLETPFEICFERIKDDNNRPLSKLGFEKLEKLCRERRELLENPISILSKNDLVAYILSQSLAAKNSK